jgi:site-specific recombinase XerD
MWLSFVHDLNVDMGCKTYNKTIIPPYRVADDLVPYCLRHTFCTDLQDAGVPINVAIELMGHTDIATTAKIYTHGTERTFSAALDAMNNLQKAINT